MSEYLPTPDDECVPSTTTETGLTDAERETLAAVAWSSPELAERERELNRLRFARWLVEKGIVNELLEEGE